MVAWNKQIEILTPNQQAGLAKYFSQTYNISMNDGVSREHKLHEGKIYG